MSPKNFDYESWLVFITNVTRFLITVDKNFGTVSEILRSKIIKLFHRVAKNYRFSAQYNHGEENPSPSFASEVLLLAWKDIFASYQFGIHITREGCIVLFCKIHKFSTCWEEHKIFLTFSFINWSLKPQWYHLYQLKKIFLRHNQLCEYRSIPTTEKNSHPEWIERKYLVQRRLMICIFEN